MPEALTRSAVALFSGACVVPLFLWVVFRAMFPVEATGSGNVAFWSIVAFGSCLAAAIVWFKAVPLWVAAIAGCLGVLAFLVPWVAWKIGNGA